MFNTTFQSPTPYGKFATSLFLQCALLSFVAVPWTVSTLKNNISAPPSILVYKPLPPEPTVKQKITASAATSSTALSVPTRPTRMFTLPNPNRPINMDGPDSKIIDLPGEGYSFGSSNQTVPGANIIGSGAAINALPAPPPTVAAKPAPATIPTTINVGGRVQAAMIQHRVEPIYPTLAKQTRVQGTVVLAAVIGTDGHIQALRVVSGHPLLIGEAMKAVQQWTYNPTFLNDQKVSVSTTIEVRFTLTN